MLIDQTGFTRNALTELRYRPDIDGLRAVAVLAVVSIVFTAVTGHTGAESSWKDFIKGSDKKLEKLKASAHPTPPPPAVPAK